MIARTSNVTTITPRLNAIVVNGLNKMTRPYISDMYSAMTTKP